MKTYVITLSQVFPATHARAGEPTGFKDAFLEGQKRLFDGKRHTIRANYELWEKRFKEIDEGKACLAIRQWSGKPYRSKQVELARLTKENGIGIQKLCFLEDRGGNRSLILFTIDGNAHMRRFLAKNDGLSLEDLEEWFKNYDLSKPLAVIHFTSFRY
jgi:hypothetical protein